MKPARFKPPYSTTLVIRRRAHVPSSGIEVRSVLIVRLGRVLRALVVMDGLF